MGCVQFIMDAERIKGNILLSVSQMESMSLCPLPIIK